MDRGFHMNYDFIMDGEGKGGGGNTTQSEEMGAINAMRFLSSHTHTHKCGIMETKI